MNLPGQSPEPGVPDLVFLDLSGGITVLINIRKDFLRTFATSGVREAKSASFPGFRAIVAQCSRNAGSKKRRWRYCVGFPGGSSPPSGLTRPRVGARSPTSGESLPAAEAGECDAKRPLSSDAISSRGVSHRRPCPSLVASFAAGVAALERWPASPRAHRHLPLRCAGALGDERRVAPATKVTRILTSVRVPGRVVRRGRCDVQLWRRRASSSPPSIYSDGFRLLRLGIYQQRRRRLLIAAHSRAFVAGDDQALLPPKHCGLVGQAPAARTSSIRRWAVTRVQRNRAEQHSSRKARDTAPEHLITIRYVNAPISLEGQ
jgi:hypothetical protein